MQQHADIVTDPKGNVVKGASVRVLLLDGTLATIYATNGGAPTGNPLTSGQLGEFSFYAPNGDYLLEITAGGKVQGTSGPIKLYDVLDDDDAARLSSLGAADGAEKIGYGGESVKETLDALQLADYAALRAYAGPRKSVCVTGHMVSATPSGIAGMFVRDDTDTTSADDGGTIIVSATGKRWKRKYSGKVMVTWFGAGRGDAEADTVAFETCLAKFKALHAPVAEYFIKRELVIPTDRYITGDGMRQSIINSQLIGASLFRTAAPDGMQVGYIADLQLVGNNLTGAAGNGHAINFVDPALGAGAWAPQGITVERVWIRRFRGQDVRDNGTVNKIAAAGIICVEGLQNVYRDVIVHECGNGFYLERTQTNKLENCIAYTCDKAGVVTYETVGTVIEKCDILGNGTSGTTDAGYPNSGLDVANLISFKDEGLVVEKSKFKNTNGIAQLHLLNSYGAVIEKNQIRSDGDTSRAKVVNNGIRAVKCSGLKVLKNTLSFGVQAGTSATSVKAKHINLVTDALNEIFNGEVVGNTFLTQSGVLVEYNLCIESTGSAACKFAGLDIEFNRFGTPLAIGTASVIDYDILVRNSSLTYSKIRNNVHYAQTNVTRTRCISGEGLTAESNNNIGQNLFQTDGTGVITTKYFGFLYPTLRIGSKTYDPPSLAANATTSTTVTVTNALVGEPVQYSFSQPLQGIEMTPQVTTNGTVTVYLHNPTGSTIDLASGTLVVIVSRTAIAEVS